jgi:hypothetical protein
MSSHLNWAMYRDITSALSYPEGWRASLSQAAKLELVASSTLVTRPYTNLQLVDEKLSSITPWASY